MKLLTLGLWITLSGIAFQGCLHVQLPALQIHRGQEQAPVSWMDAVQQALAANPDLKQARQQVASAARTRDAAAGSYLPSVSGEYDRDYARTTSSLTRDSQGLSISASQPLFTGFRITGDFLKAKRELEAEEYAYLETSAEVRFRLRSVYVDMMRLARLDETNREIAQRRAQNAEMIRLRYEAGREHKGSMLRAQAIADQAAFEVRQTGRALESQSLRLSRELGGDFSTPLPVRGDLEKEVPALTGETPDFAVMAEKNPKVRRLVKTAESLKAGILSAQSVVWPQAEGTYDYGYSGPHASALRDSSSLGLKVSVPFFEGGRNIADIRKARSDYGASLEEARSARDETAVTQAEAWAAFQNAVDFVAVRRHFLEAGRERADIIRSQYATGLVNYQDFDLAEQDLVEAQKAYVEALANALTQEAGWEFSKGSTLEELVLES